MVPFLHQSFIQDLYTHRWKQLMKYFLEASFPLVNFCFPFIFFVTSFCYGSSYILHSFLPQCLRQCPSRCVTGISPLIFNSVQPTSWISLKIHRQQTTGFQTETVRERGVMLSSKLFLHGQPDARGHSCLKLYIFAFSGYRSVLCFGVIVRNLRHNV
jgi:hypothetical protein